MRFVPHHISRLTLVHQIWFVNNTWLTYRGVSKCLSQLQ